MMRTAHPALRRRGAWLLVAGAALLAGCSTFSDERGFSPVQQAARERLNADAAWPRDDAERDTLEQRVARLLEQPLSVDSAVQVALLNNRGLQATFQELGIGEAELVQAGRLPNPGFFYSRQKRGGEVEIERLLVVNLAHLLAMPMIGEIEQRRFAQTQALVTLQMLGLAADTRKAYFNAVAAGETARYTRQVMQAAQASAELARRMQQVGNFNKLQRAREQSFYADAALNLARAEQAERAARERLTRLLGVWGEQTAYRLPERLPDLPDAVREQPDIEREAMAQRLDVQGARLAAEQTAKNLGLMRATRFVNVLEVGAIYDTSNEAPAKRGWEVGFELPLFDWGDARVAKAEAIYLQAFHRAAQTAVNARSEVREAYTGLRTAYDIARFQRDEVVPLRRQIAEENLLRYNGMLIGVFELLADARAQIASVNDYIVALRDFWVAQSDLEMALIGKPSLSPAAAPALAAVGGGAAH